MIIEIAASILPIGFLIVLFGGGALFLRKKIEQDGDAPIKRTLFYFSKYSILILWGAMVIQIWGVSISIIEVPTLIQAIGLILWFLGFALLYIGRFEMGGSFRLGIPKEHTHLRVHGLFRFSRNPMYVGMYATVIASAIYTLNPILILLGAFVIYIHHSIVLEEEKHMQKVFGREYMNYFRSVRRYI